MEGTINLQGEIGVTRFADDVYPMVPPGAHGGSRGGDPLSCSWYIHSIVEPPPRNSPTLYYFTVK